MPQQRSILEAVVDSSKAESGIQRIQSAWSRMLAFASREFDRFQSMANKVGSGLGTSISSSFSNAAKSVADSFAKMNRSANSFFSNMKTSIIGGRNNWELFRDSISNSFGALTKLKGLLLPAGIIGFGEAITDVGIKFQRFLTTLTVITGSVSEARDELRWLKEQTDSVGISFETSAQSYSRFAAAAVESFNTVEIREIFAAFSEASAALFLNRQEIQGVYLAIQQMASKGKIAMEELRLQLAERIPGAMQIAADTMDMTVGELEEQIRKGMISAEDFLLRFARGISEKFGDAASIASNSIIGSMNRLKNSAFDFLQEIAHSGFFEGLRTVVDEFDRFLADNSAFARQLGSFLGEMLSDLGEWIGQLTSQDLEDALNFILNTFRSIYDLLGSMGDLPFFGNLFKSISEARKLELDETNSNINRLEKIIPKLTGTMDGSWTWGTASLFERETARAISGAGFNASADQVMAHYDQLRSRAEDLSTQVSILTDSVSDGGSISEGHKEFNQVLADEAAAIEQLGIKYETWQQKLEDIRDPNRELNKLLSDRKKVEEEITTLEQRLMEQDTNTRSGLSNAVTITKQLWEAEQTRLGIIGEIEKIQKQEAASLAKLARERERAAKAVERENKELNDLARKYDPAIDAALTYSDTLTELNRIREAGRITTTAYWHAVIEARKELEEYGKKDKELNALEEFAKDAKDIHSRLNDAVVDAFKGMEDAVIEFARTGKFEITDFVNSFLEQMLRMQLQSNVTGPAAAFVNGFLSGIFNPATSSAAPTQIQQPGGGVGWINPSGVAKFHEGTDYVPRDGLAFLHKGEAVVPASQNVGGKTSVVINEAPPGTTVSRSTGSNGEELINVILGKVANDVNSGGVISNAITNRFGVRGMGISR